MGGREAEVPLSLNVEAGSQKKTRDLHLRLQRLRPCRRWQPPTAALLTAPRARRTFRSSVNDATGTGERAEGASAAGRALDPALRGTHGEGRAGLVGGTVPTTAQIAEMSLPTAQPPHLGQELFDVSRSVAKELNDIVETLVRTPRDLLALKIEAQIDFVIPLRITTSTEALPSDACLRFTQRNPRRRNDAEGGVEAVLHLLQVVAGQRFDHAGNGIGVHCARAG